MKERIANESEFISYIKRSRDQLIIEASSLSKEPYSSIGVIVTVRPGGDSKVWFKLLSGSVEASDLAKISKSLESIDAPVVKQGVVPFSFALKLGGASEQFDTLPMADIWFEGQEETGEITSLINKVWK
jgi:hypothetical protein